jgi:beta-fructofuranosidase
MDVGRTTAPVFFRPRDAWVGDVIPYEQDGQFWLYYLLERRDAPPQGMPWHLVTTRDLVTLTDRGLALPAGDADAEDVNCYTGSVVRDEQGLHHLFYTAQNPTVLGDDGLPLQLVAHATSQDGMATWTKHPEHTFGATSGYQPSDWRDPFVFRHPDGRWHMLLAARHMTGPERRRGVIARCVSEDLVTWESAEPFWDPRRYITHECPEVFQWGEWWYLVYSEFSDRFVTRYRMARSPEGPWEVPLHDSLDGRAWYAAKSAARDGRRFFFGWIASRAGQRDDGAWQWAGSLSTLEAVQREDGTLAMRPPAELVDTFSEDRSAQLGLAKGVLEARDSYAATVSDHDTPSQFHTRVVVDVEDGTREFGLLVRCSEDGDTGYVLRLEPHASRMVLDRWPRRTTGAAQWQVSGDVPQFIELERPVDLPPGRHVLEAVIDDDLAVFTLDGAVTLSTPLYDHRRGRLGVFVGEGRLEVVEANLSRRPSGPAAHPSVPADDLGQPTHPTTDNTDAADDTELPDDNALPSRPTTTDPGDTGSAARRSAP